MDKGDFLCLCVSKGISILTIYDVNLNKYKKLTKHFNYLCDFDEDGVCTARTDSSCCCGNCGHNVGYLTNIEDAVNRIDEYASKYNEIDGFWRYKTGCTLPRKLRSAICTAFVCGTTLKKFKSMNSNAVVKFMELLYDYNRLSPKDKKRIHRLYISIRNSM